MKLDGPVKIYNSYITVPGIGTIDAEVIDTPHLTAARDRSGRMFRLVDGTWRQTRRAEDAELIRRAATRVHR